MKKLFLLLFIINVSLIANAQLVNTNPFENRILQKYYTKAELTHMNIHFHEKFKKLKYYYIHSFIIDPTTAAACPSFDPDLFDISDYESYRIPSRRTDITLPCGVIITLLSQREIDLLIYYDGILPAEDTIER